MSRSSYSGGKRERDASKTRKKRDKAAKRTRRLRQGPSVVPVVEQEAITGDLKVIEANIRARKAAAARSSRTIPARLFIGSLARETTGQDLEAAFKVHGAVAEAVVVMDRDTGRSRGFGFVVMADHRDANRAIEAMHDSEMGGRRIVVNVATERQR